jgi:hypothetical protein
MCARAYSSINLTALSSFRSTESGVNCIGFCTIKERPFTERRKESLCMRCTHNLGPFGATLADLALCSPAFCTGDDDGNERVTECAPPSKELS